MNALVDADASRRSSSALVLALFDGGLRVSESAQRTLRRIAGRRARAADRRRASSAGWSSLGDPVELVRDKAEEFKQLDIAAPGETRLGSTSRPALRPLAHRAATSSASAPLTGVGEGSYPAALLRRAHDRPQPLDPAQPADRGAGRDRARRPAAAARDPDRGRLGGRSRAGARCRARRGGRPRRCSRRRAVHARRRRRSTGCGRSRRWPGSGCSAWRSASRCVIAPETAAGAARDRALPWRIAAVAVPAARRAAGRRRSTSPTSTSGSARGDRAQLAAAAARRPRAPRNASIRSRCRRATSRRARWRRWGGAPPPAPSCWPRSTASRENFVTMALLGDLETRAGRRPARVPGTGARSRSTRSTSGCASSPAAVADASRALPDALLPARRWAPRRRGSPRSPAALRERGDEVTVHTGFPNYPDGRILAAVPQPAAAARARRGRHARRAQRGLRRRPTRLRAPAGQPRRFAASALATAPAAGRADVVVVETPPLFRRGAAVAYARLKRAPLVLNAADLWPDSAVEHRRARRRPRDRGRASAGGVGYRHAAAITVPTEGMVAAARRAPAARGRAVHMPPAVDLERFDGLARRRTAPPAARALRRHARAGARARDARRGRAARGPDRSST